MEERIGPAARWLHLRDDLVRRARHLAGHDPARRRGPAPRGRRSGDGRGEEARLRAQAHGDDRPQPRHPRRADLLRAQAGDLVRRAAPRAASGCVRARDGDRGGEDLRRGGHVRAPASVGGGARLQGAGAARRRRPRARSSSAIATPSSSARSRCSARRIEKFAVEIRHLQRTEVREVGGAVHRGPEGQLGDAPQAQPDPLARTSPAWRGCCAATR